LQIILEFSPVNHLTTKVSIDLNSSSLQPGAGHFELASTLQHFVVFFPLTQQLQLHHNAVDGQPPTQFKA